MDTMMDTIDNKPTGYLEIPDLWVEDKETRAKLMDILSTWVATGLSYADFLKAYQVINPDGFDISGIVYHSLPDKEHDGKLEAMPTETRFGDVTAHVWHCTLATGKELVSIAGGYPNGYAVDQLPVYIDAKQALSLLDWLLREKETLMKLAKEQAT